MQQKTRISLLLMLLLVVFMSISCVSAQELDNSTNNLIDSNDDAISIENNNEYEDILSQSNDDELGFTEPNSNSYIKFDEEEITITEGDTFTVTGNLVDYNGNNPNGDDFSVIISSNGKTAYKDLSNHRLSYTFDSSWSFAAKDTPYLIEFTPDDTGEYWANYVEMTGLEMSKSWVKLTVNPQASQQPTLPKANTVYNGAVSGNVDVATVNPWNTKGQLTYEIPVEAKDIKNAIVYVNIYAGSGSNPNYALDSNTTITTSNGKINLGYEELLTTECSPDGTVYTISGNDHVTRVYSDYQSLYNVTDIVKGLNGTSISINVDSIQKSGYQFDGRIKLIALVLAYDDGDEDIVNYWVDANQMYSTENMNLEFDTSSLKFIDEASWFNVVLSSTDAGYKVNNYPVGDADKHESGNYYQFNKWTVTESLNPSSKTTLTYSNNGYSTKSVLAVLTVKTHELPTATVNSITPEYSGTAYPGTVNALTVKVTPSRDGKYIVKLLADDEVVNTTEVDLTAGSNTITIVDPTIRALDETTVVNNDNKNVKWTIEIVSDDTTIATKDLTAKILYNGYLGSEYAFGIEGYKELINVSFTGDIIVDIKGDSTYKSSGTGGRTDVWTVNLNENSNIVGGFIIVPYNWFNYGNGANIEDSNMIEATFNGNSLTAIAFAHDNPNLGWNYGYGSLIYDVSDLINASGDNSLVLNRLVGNPALNPSIFVYYYNTTGSSIIKNLYMVNGYDLFNNDYNKAGRVNQANSIINVDVSKINDATIYIFAAGADRTDGHVIVNDNEFNNCWNGNGNTADLFKTDITSIVKESNEVSFVSTGGTISSLAQFIVTSKDFVQATATVKAKDNSKNIVYPGFNNTLTITVNTNKQGKYVVKLLADGNEVNSTEIDLINGENTLTLVDPTIRSLPENATYIGALGEYDKVDYQLKVIFEDETVGQTSYEALVLYNGYLGKDTYNQNSLEAFYTGTISGDMVILTNGSYATGTVNTFANFTVILPENSNLVKAFMYVSYCYGSGGKDNINMFNVTLNGNKLAPIYFARDQSNLAANSGYGIVVYDVTDYAVNGNNVFELNKTISAGVYPSTLIYMYNTTGSKLVKEIYISNGADLLGSYGGLNNPIRVDSVINVDSKDVKNAAAYIFANGAVDGRGIVVINGEIEDHPWNGNSQSTDLYSKDITSNIRDSNEISVIFNATSGSFTSLQQIIVLTKELKENDNKDDGNSNSGTSGDSSKINKKVTKKATKIIAKKKTFKAKKKVKKYTITLKAGKKPVKKVKVTLKIKGKIYKAKTNAKGKAIFKIKNLKKKGTYKAIIKFKGNKYYKASSKKVKIKVKK